MAIIANTFTSYDAVGVREQLSDIIYNIAPTKTPFLSMCKKGKATNTLFEWQKDSLDAAANNAQLDGDDATFQSVTPTVRINNRTQISRKTLIISGTEEALNKAGRKSEIAYQVAKKGKELKRDMEIALTQNGTAVTGSTTVARQTRGLEGWIATNNNLGATGVAPNPDTNTAAVDGTARTITEAMVKDVQQKCYSAGGDGANILMVGATQKQDVSAFTGGATKMDKTEDQALYAAISVYYGDFGKITVVPNILQRARTGFLLDPSLFQVNYLRSFFVKALAPTGDAEKRMLIVEYGLQSNEEAGSGAIRDLS